MPKFNIKDAADWREISGIKVYHDGADRSIKNVWAKRSGAWRMIFRRGLAIDIAANTTDLDLFTAAGSPDVPVDIILTVGLGVQVSASTPNNPAIYCSQDLPAGSSLYLLNKGSVDGCNGRGGAGGSGDHPASYFYRPLPGEDGEQGSAALSLGCPTVINNTAGHLWGGGGGGGGAGGINYYWLPSYIVLLTGAGGGGFTGGLPGAAFSYNSSNWVLGQPGGDAGTLAAAAGGAGSVFQGIGNIDGGACRGVGLSGLPGETAGYTVNGSTFYQPPALPGAGGDVGPAVDTNGHALVWAGGFNADQVKGSFD